MFRRNKLIMFKSFCLAILIVGATAFSTSADIIISFDTEGSFNVNLGAPGPGMTVDFYIGETQDAAHLLGVANPQFALEQGTVSDPPGTISDGTAATSHYFAAGNHQTSTIDKFSSGSFGINQEYTNGMQPLADVSSSSLQLWFTLNLSTMGLSDGVYAINLVDNPDGSFLSSTGNPVAYTNNLTFTVTSIPEPGTFAMFAFAGGVIGLVRRRRLVSSQVG